MIMTSAEKVILWNGCNTRDREAAHSATYFTVLFNIEERNPGYRS